MRADRQQRPDPSRLQHRPGRLRFRVLWPGWPWEGAADRPGADQGRHSAQRALGWSLRKADQAVVQGNHCGGASGARWHARSEGRGAGVMEEAPVKIALVDINDILKTLPHRYPMLLIDRVVNIR